MRPGLVPVPAADLALAADALDALAADLRRSAGRRSLSGSRYTKARETLRREAEGHAAAAARLRRVLGRAA